MRILVSGASGLLGSNVAASAVQQSWEVLGLWHATPVRVPGASALAVDVADRRACVSAANGFEPDAIVHGAIGGDPGRFEREPALADLARSGVEHTLAAARAVRARYVLVSCDWVFSGLRPPGERWDETDVTEPVNAYGRALLQAEELVRSEGDVEWLIVRAGDPYGVNLSRPIELGAPARGHGGRGHREWRELAGVPGQGALVRHVWERSGAALRILARLRDGELPLPAPADVRRSPTYAWDFAQRLCELIAQDREGVYHLSGPDSVHRREYVRTIAHAFGCAPARVVDGDIASYLRALGEPGELALPPNTALDCRRASAALGHPAVEVQEGLWLMGDQLRRVLER
jgi:dTDP-4-dehydrorhamnose reductase